MANPKLILLSEPMRGQTHELTRDTYTIGRTEDRDVCIVDPTVSSLHAIVTRNPDGSYSVKDNNSTNCTRINGVIITEQKLVSSDILQVGGIEIMYEWDAESNPTSRTGTKTSIQLNPDQINKPNEPGLLGPKSGETFADSPVLATAFKVVIGVLVVVVLVLAVVLVRRIMAG